MGNTTPTRFYTSNEEMFKDLAPQYMAMGMTYEEYWNGEADRCIYARKALEYKRKLENENQHRQGFYFYSAITTAIAQAFGDKKATYLEEPIPLTQADIDEREERRIKKEREKLIASMNATIELMKKSGKFDKEGE